MRISDGSGLDGVSGAAGPEPAFDGHGDSRLYANNTPASQAYFNDDAPPSFERVHEMVDRAVERVKKHLKWEGPAQPPWYPPPGHDNFRREYRHLLWDVQDPAHRAYIKKRFIRLWRYLQDRYHHKKRGGYPDKLRDAYFEQDEVRADLHIGWGNASARPWAYPPLRIEVKEYLDKHRGTDRWCAFFTSDPHQVASLVPHVDDEDFPPDLLPIMKKYAVLAACDPAAIVDFWTATEHRNIHGRIWEPLLREAQAKVDALNVGAPAPEEPTRRLVEEDPAIVEEEKPSDVVKAAPDDDVSSDWKLRIGITNQLSAYVLRYPAAIAGLRANGFRPEYFGCDHAFFADLFEIAQMPEDQWNRRLAELKLKHSAEYSRLRLGEHLPALSSGELAEYFIPLAGIIQPNPAPVVTKIGSNGPDLTAARPGATGSARIDTARRLPCVEYGTGQHAVSAALVLKPPAQIPRSSAAGLRRRSAVTCRSRYFSSKLKPLFPPANAVRWRTVIFDPKEMIAPKFTPRGLA